jgi:hypothetical protein
MTEAKFQLLWKKQAFADQVLVTTSGKKIQLLKPGTINFGPGPDFLGACLRIDNEEHTGNIELHLHAKDWYNHGHHKDSMYDSVILHVFPAQPLSSEFNTLNSCENAIEMLMVKKPSSQLEEEMLISRPCETTLLHSKLFKKQAELASLSYLNESTLHLLSLGNTQQGLEQSFKQSIILRIFELLGAPYQKEAGLKLGECVFNCLQNQISLNLDELILNSGFKNWGLGKSGHQKAFEALELVKFLYQAQLPVKLNDFIQFHTYVSETIRSTIKSTFWQDTLIRNVSCVAAYSWASLIYQIKAMQYFKQEWIQYPIELPNSIKKQIPEPIKSHYGKNGFEFTKTYPNFLLDQHKTFCSKWNCLACNFFESASNS